MIDVEGGGCLWWWCEVGRYGILRFEVLLLDRSDQVRIAGLMVGRFGGASDVYIVVRTAQLGAGVVSS